MPATPLHYPVAWGLSKLNKKLNLPGLIIGSFIPDVEVPILFLFFNVGIDNHFILHSLVGALTIGTIISILVTVYIYPILTSLIFRFDKSNLKEVCRLTPILVFSCMLGNIFHLLLDLIMHPYSLILWPFVDPHKIVGILVLVFAVGGDLQLGFLIANVLTNLVMGLFMVAIIIKNRRNLWEQILIGQKKNDLKF
ncbi:MAG: DUF4184 family protein [Candidatus Hermodarchaeota archaeon]